MTIFQYKWPQNASITRDLWRYKYLNPGRFSVFLWKTKLQRWNGHVFGTLHPVAYYVNYTLWLLLLFFVIWLRVVAITIRFVNIHTIVVCVIHTHFTFFSPFVSLIHSLRHTHTIFILFDPFQRHYAFVSSKIVVTLGINYIVNVLCYLSLWCMCCTFSIAETLHTLNCSANSIQFRSNRNNNNNGSSRKQANVYCI